jgi:hypothetical protein
MVRFGLPALFVAASFGCEKPPPAAAPEEVFGHCAYTNSFSDRAECREFRGTGWTEEDATANCAEWDATFATGACPADSYLGACVLDDSAERFLQALVVGTDASTCANNERGCELFGGGTFVERGVCAGEGVDDLVDDAYSETYYTPAVNICMDPVDDVAGQSAGGQVCTWQQMSGCTEEGRRYDDYASCDAIRTQRPYSPVPANSTEPAVDPRLDDEEYAAELAWVTAQTEACSCVCCHDSRITPDNQAGVFDVNFAGSNNWVNSFTTWGLAFSANAFDTSLLGTYRAEENNGFERTISGMPSTDQARMKRFFEQELIHRGSSVAEFADLDPSPAIFYEQRIYEPGPCENGEGVNASGVMTWRGGRARYVYVLAAGSANPGTPPSEDIPERTLWRVDTIPPAIPVRTGELTYGTLPAGMLQTTPANNAAPPALVSGQDYYLVALADIGVPMTRCIFTAP